MFSLSLSFSILKIIDVRFVHSQYIGQHVNRKFSNGLKTTFAQRQFKRTTILNKIPLNDLNFSKTLFFL